MEWTKKELTNTCILVKSNAHAKKVIKFYESYGFQNKITQIPKIGWYISAVDFISQHDILFADVICYTIDYPPPRKLIEIKLHSKPRRKFPREMMISNNKTHWRQLKVFGKVQSQWLTESGYQKYIAWNYAKEID